MSTLKHLRQVYAEQSIGAFQKAYEEVRKRDPLLYLPLRLIERIYPIREFLAFAVRLDREIAASGLSAASRQFLEEIFPYWECEIPKEAEALLRSAPLILYGNHPSLLTPFLIAAHVDRPDWRCLSANYVDRLLPHFADYGFPVKIPIDQKWIEWRRGGLRRLLIFTLLSRLQRSLPHEAAKELNRRSLDAAIEHVCNGGSMLIAPDGGGKRLQKWHSGIGMLAQGVAQRSTAVPTYVVPFREENTTNPRVYAYLRRGPVARLKHSLFYRRPIRVRFAEPMVLGDIVVPGERVEQTVLRLRRRYKSAFDLLATGRE
jgi:hypothetical protein